MKRALLVLSLLVASSPLHAQRLVDFNASLRDYASKVMPRCPGGALTLESVGSGVGPTNFNTYVVQLRSTDKYCGSQKYLMHSPKTGQVLIGQVVPLPADGRPVAARITEQATSMLNKQVKATVSPFPLPDGIKAVNIMRDTEFGPFSYHAFVDQSEKFLLVAFRGNLTTDPAKSLRDALGVTNAAKRGTGKVEILELSDFQCPTCAHAHEKLEPIIKQNLGKMSYTRLDLPLFENHEWAIHAAMGARAIQKVAPAKYWQYVDYVFKNQESIGQRKFDAVLKEWLEDNDVSWTEVQKTYSSKTERAALLDQVARAFAIGVASTPTFIVNGQIMGFGPDGTFTIDAIKSAIGANTPKAAAPKKTGK
jgi:protein-disulfide isomerase